jgi:hypothetical protein
MLPRNQRSGTACSAVVDGGIGSAVTRRVQKVLGILSVSLWAIIQFSISAHADTASYPQNNSLFTIEVAKGWQAKHEHGALKIEAQANALFLVQHVDNVKDESAAKGALPQLAEMEGRQFNMQDVKIAVHGMPVQMGEFKGLMTNCAGRDKAGNETLWQVMIFTPKEDDYYLVTCFWTKEDGEKTATDRAEIFSSLKAAGLN